MRMLILKSLDYSQQKRLDKLISAYKERYGQKPEVVVRVPGRVNLIGEHIDYCGYAVHPMAIDQDILVAVSKCDDQRLKLANTNPRFVDFDLDLSCDVISIDKDGSNWSNYFLCGVKGVVEEVSKGANPVGVSCLVDGTIPPSSGLSSSSALVVASCLVTLWANGLLEQVSRSEIANLCARSERFIGTQGGGMDQAIEMLAREGTAKLIEFNPLTATDVKLPHGATFVIANSLAEINKAAGPEFNTRVAETKLGAKLLAKLMGLDHWKSVKKFKEVSADLFGLLNSARLLLHAEPYTREEVCALLKVNDDQLMTECLTENTQHLQEFELHNRAVHVLTEATRVYQFKSICDEAASAETELPQELAGQEVSPALVRLGNLMYASHSSCADLYQCSHVQLDKLVQLSRKYGALGARLTGAGWGGCIVALVRTAFLDSFIQGLEKEYYSDLPAAQGKERMEFIFPTKPGGGAEIYSVA